MPGLNGSILDIVCALRPQFAIVDGIVGMEGDGPIMGTPKPAGVLVMGRNLPAVDATCARIMGVDPHRVRYLAEAGRCLGPVHAAEIIQADLFDQPPGQPDIHFGALPGNGFDLDFPR